MLHDLYMAIPDYILGGYEGVISVSFPVSHFYTFVLIVLIFL